MTHSPKRDKVDQLHEGQERAALRRHRGESTGQHKSWELSPKPLAVRREEQAEWDCFDYWLVEVAARVREIVAEYVSPEVLTARQEWADLMDTF
jgi:hypothetical protein